MFQCSTRLCRCASWLFHLSKRKNYQPGKRGIAIPIYDDTTNVGYDLITSPGHRLSSSASGQYQPVLCSIPVEGFKRPRSQGRTYRGTVSDPQQPSTPFESRAFTLHTDSFGFCYIHLASPYSYDLSLRNSGGYFGESRYSYTIQCVGLAACRCPVPSATTA
jgi:hypothetical protein